MKPRIGVFGAHRGMSMIRMLLAYPEAELVAVCDKYVPSLEQVKQEAEAAGMNPALYESFEDFIRHDMDAVVLANYATEHATFAVRCLDRGLHVLSECLPCETMAQAVALVEAVERSGKVYAYAENCCYMPWAFEMWQLYKEGGLGDVTYAECEYLHDCTSIWPQITYGDPNHWRNLMHPTFYCTHSLGPIITATGRRPVQVTGYECPRLDYSLETMGIRFGAGIEMVTLDNGAVVKSLHGQVCRHDANGWNFQLYCQKGMMESGRFREQKQLNVFRVDESDYGHGTWERYDPVNEIAREYVRKSSIGKGHGGADFYAPYFFIEKILGRPDGQWSIDVHQALDMGICGILAWRSALNGNIPIAVPDLRDPAQRDAWRNDNACTAPAVAGDQLLPVTSYPCPEVTAEKYEEVRQIFLQGEEKRKKEAK